MYIQSAFSLKKINKIQGICMLSIQSDGIHHGQHQKFMFKSEGNWKKPLNFCSFLQLLHFVQCLKALRACLLLGTPNLISKYFNTSILQNTRRRQWHPTPVLLPGKSHGWRSLVGCSPWGREESDMTERLHFHFALLCIGEGNGNPLHCSCLENPRDGVAELDMTEVT